jgi:hypothetical protein
MKTRLVVAALLLACVPASADPAGPARKIQNQLDALAAAMDAAAKEIAAAGPDDLTAARASLNRLAGSQPWLTNAGLVDAAGQLAVLEPARYRKNEGRSIAGQPQVREIMATRRPVMSSQFRMVEGFEAVDVEVPLPGGRAFAGAVSATFKPSALLGPLVGSSSASSTVVVLQASDGRVLWPAKEADIPPQLERAMKHILPKARGRAFVGKDELRWVSAGLHGTAWRVVEVPRTQ